MPLITDRKHVLDIYAEAEANKWVLPTFNSENLTTCEAILQAVYDFGQVRGIPDLPIIIGITCRYPARPQSVYYSHSRNWELGLRLFMADLQVLTAIESPYANLRVMVHLDHVQWDLDQELLNWNMGQFSSIMYDASTLPIEENINRTSQFMEEQGKIVFIEGACDEIGHGSSSSEDTNSATMAEEYYKQTGVDLIVANLGTEHRAAESKLDYNRNLAREITRRIGPRLCLHGSSSVAPDNLVQLFDDGVRKVNLWTALERDSTQVLFKQMLQNASKMIGPEQVQDLIADNLLGESAERKTGPSPEYFTTTYRQQTIFKTMQEIVTRYLDLWYK